VGAVSAPAHAGSASADVNSIKGLIEGKDSFSIIKPQNWTVHVDDAKTKGLYAYLVVNGYTYDDSPGLMYIRVMDKLGLSVEEHLKSDMDSYRKMKTPVKFEPFRIHKLKYAYAAKKYTIDKTPCDHLCYLDPGKEEPVYFFCFDCRCKALRQLQGRFHDDARNIYLGRQDSSYPVIERANSFPQPPHTLAS
jgi:hypothetical protein